MKRFLLTSWITLTCAALPFFSWATEPSFNCSACEKGRLFSTNLSQAEELDKITYVRFGGGAIATKQDFEEVSPSIGLGRRYELGSAAVDVSTGYTMAEMQMHDKERDNWYSDTTYFYSLPKLLYLQYGQPQSTGSFFYGAGMSWSGLKNPLEGQRFHGIFGEFAFGYEGQRYSRLRTIAQVDISQPMIAYHRKGHFPPATVTLSLGFGF